MANPERELPKTDGSATTKAVTLAMKFISNVCGVKDNNFPSTIKQFKKLKRRTVYYVSSYFYSFHCSFFFPDVPSFLLLLFTFYLENTL